MDLRIGPTTYFIIGLLDYRVGPARLPSGKFAPPHPNRAPHWQTFGPVTGLDYSPEGPEVIWGAVIGGEGVLGRLWGASFTEFSVGLQERR